MRVESYLAELGLPADFNPTQELLNFTSVEGDESVPFHAFDQFLHEQLKNEVIYGVILGASGIAMIALFIVSKNRKTPVFILNQLSLTAILMHALFYIVYSFGGANTITTQFTGFYELTVSKSDLHVTSVTNVLQLLFVFFIECSMVFQIKTIFQAPNDRVYQYVLTTLSALIATATVVMYFYTAVVSIKALEAYESVTSRMFDIQKIMFTVSVAFISFLLAIKLVRAIRTRRYLGLKQFDGFHILLITSTQSLIIPTVLMILSATVKPLSKLEFNALSNFFVAISLPLSSMWASSANDSKMPTSTTGVYTPSSYYPSGKGTSYYSDRATTLKQDDIDYDRKIDQKSGDENVFTPTTAAEDEAKRYWFNNPQFDDELNDEMNEDLVNNEINFSSTHELNEKN
ncbi:hypothetical protein WICPIJ_006834 [Wickerhamomyces pijperi]|uniref:Pheromone alpha factor receptor n=1 Tax=Wickerhamomyces pijperi TaxID=599730 RepID=A0A9P8Q123_WICPI|nr:hypothetical protein WICPIJ_006834 [Wickerhamomyces pijperi]